MREPDTLPTSQEFTPPTRYVAFLWTVLGAVQLGLLVLWKSPWYAATVFDTPSWVVWLLFDLFLIAGVTQATRFRVRTSENSLEYLAWNFRWIRWDWDEISRVDRWSGAIGPRYRVRATRGAFYFSRVSINDSARLAAIVVAQADLDDMGEHTMSMQAGARHVWLHPSVADDD